MRWHKESRSEWRSDDGYHIVHSSFGLAMYHLRGPAGSGRAASGIGGSSSLAGAKRMAERHQLEQRCLGLLTPGVKMRDVSTAELRKLAASAKREEV